MVTVVAALIKKDDKYLIARRANGSPDAIGRWEFPGGKVEPGETEECAIEREIKEELSIDIKAIKFIANNIFENPYKTIDLRLYECEYVGGNFDLHDHYEYKYVGIDEFDNIDWCPGDIPLAEYIRNR